jgi:hypothetical protein
MEVVLIDDFANSMLIFSLTLLLHLLDLLGLPQRAILILQEKILQCLSRFMAQHLISLEWELVSQNRSPCTSH